MPTLGIVMIVKNEAGCLSECLASVRNIADEIVIGDTGSTDDTVIIARSFGATVLPVEWKDDFAEARNCVLAAAASDWLLHMDADEVLDPSGAKAARALVDADGAGADAVEVTLANYCDDPRAWRWTPADRENPLSKGRAGYIAVGLTRLFRNGRGYRYRERVHENLADSLREAEAIVRVEPILIHHHGFGAGGPEKSARYLAIAQRKVKERPDDPKAWHDLGEQLLSMDRTDEAEAAVMRAVDLDPVHLGAATTLANILLNRGALDDAAAILLRLEQAGLTAPHVLTALAAIDIRKGRIPIAKDRLERVAAAAPHQLLARLYLARVYDVMEDFEAAREQLELAMTIAPGIAEVQGRVAAHGLRLEGELALAEGDARGALATLVSALHEDNEDPLIHARIATALEVLGQRNAARQAWERARTLCPAVENSER